ncbi:COG5395 Predicted membrane protein [Caulobacteraceae bacterium]|jgi:uncharacterized membrane protein
MTLALFSKVLPASRRAGTVLTIAAGLTAVVLFGPQMLRMVTQATPHGPDIPLFLKQPTVIQAHILAAVASVLVGAVILSARKGHTFHRTMGWIWASLMAVTAGSSLFIVGLNGDHWSLIHLLSGWTLVILPFAVWAARKHRVDVHKRAMTGIFWGASIVAGLFTFLPGRLMWTLFMG